MPDESTSTSTPEQSSTDTAASSNTIDTAPASGALTAMMNSAMEKVKAVANKLATDPIYSMFISFTVNGVNINSGMGGEGGKYRDLIMSLTNVKNGSGEANNFTLLVAYAPSFDPNFDANEFEKALTISPSSEWDSATVAKKLECTLQYGYANDPSLRTVTYKGLMLNYTVDFQDGMLIYTITGYSGLTQYTESRTALSIKEITATPEDVDNGAEGNDNDSSTDNNSSSKSKSKSTGVDYGKSESTDNSKPSENSDSTTSEGETEGEETDEPIAIADTQVQVQPTVAAKYIIEKYLPNYAVSFGDVKGQSVYGSDEAVVLNCQLDKNPMKALTDILNKAIHKSQAEILDGSSTLLSQNKITYSWYVTDCETNGKPTICIIADDPLEDKSAVHTLTFNWGQPGTGTNAINHFVLSFKPQFEGSVILALADEYNATSQSEFTERVTTAKTKKKEAEERAAQTGSVGDFRQMENADAELAAADKALNDATNTEPGTDKMTTVGSYFVDEQGNLQVMEETTAAVPGGDIRTVTANLEQMKSTWVSRVQYPYKADMETFGVPCELPITGIIEINALVGYRGNISGRRHHTSGKYQILGSEDIINSSGFTTIWHLQKVEGVPINSNASESGTVDNTTTGAGASSDMKDATEQIEEGKSKASESSMD